MSKLELLAAPSPTAISARLQDYLELCKPRVVLLMLLTSVVGMHLATPGFVPWTAFILGSLGIGLAAGAAAAINHIVDRQIDATMGRTKHRPIPSGKIPIKHALGFTTLLGITGLSILYFFINPLTAFLTFFTLVGYAGFYTLFLKRTTPQNIVIGGAAGAAPPLLGWTAVTGHWAAEPLLLVLIIFVWTPPHFWSLAIARYEDYAKAKIPMLPVTHGIPFTKQCVLLYTLLLSAVTLLPFVINMSGMIYLAGTLILNGLFIWYAIQLYRTDSRLKAMQVFRYSIVYLMVLFVLLLFDHYL